MQNDKMTDTLNNTSICVLGMHRSGTSAVTRALNLLGVYLGEPARMIEILDDNPKGFWEHEGILDIHERILMALSCRWYDIWPLENEWWKLQELIEPKQDLMNLLLREFADRPLWGWKDPRTCLTLPLWNEISEELNFEIGYLIVFRNPIDIVNSLIKRNDFSLSKSYLLWQLYMLSALEETKNKKRSIISYDEFLDKWKPSLIRTTRTLDIPWPSDENYLNQEMETFLDKSLRHSHSSLDDLNRKVRNEELPESITRLYELCLKAEKEQDFINSEEFKTKVNNMYLEHITFTRMIYSEFREPLENKDRVIEGKDQAIRNKDIQIQNKDLTIQSKDLTIQNKDLIIQNNNQNIENLESTIRDRDELLANTFNTWSWKITRPLRWLADLLSKF